MICLIYNIHNALNYDVAFPELNREPVENAVGHKKARVALYDKETHLVGESREIRLYKVRLGGVIKKKQNAQRQDILVDGQIKHKLIQWNNRTGGVFLIKPNRLDRYGRIEAQLFDPVTGESFTDWLIREYPDVFRRYD